LVVFLCIVGCNDDRKRVSQDLFLCNPSSRTADYDCGDGYLCYSGAQALGDSICVPRCDPNDAANSCPNGACTRAGACLTRCNPDNPTPCSAGGGTLSCVRTNYSQKGPMADPNSAGVCLPVASSCNSSDDCLSPIFDLCSSKIEGQQNNPALATSGSVCSQGFCTRNDVACEPGSTCIGTVLPSAIKNAPDVCTPNCQRHVLANNEIIEECVPGYSCISDAFPQTASHVCTPGFAGWLCTDPLGCSAGECDDWQDVGGPFVDFKTCSPGCDNDADCIIYDRPSNPNVLTHFICQSGHCRNLQSLTFPETCLRTGDPCQLDDKATCQGPPDGGAPPAPAGTCGVIALAGSFGAFGAGGASCVHRCSENSECDELTQASHVTHYCNQMLNRCMPSLPFFTACNPGGGCVSGLNCVTLAGLPTSVCTKSCATQADCGDHPLLGTLFSCLSGFCVPKTESGCAPSPSPRPDLCLSGQLVNGLCVSPTGWACDKGNASQCQNGPCDSSGHCP
jgi:hypothetical protein